MSFVVYKSSAGSGKTFTLVKEYIKLLLTDQQMPPQKYKHILAVTFTNKAAAEMKDRVVKALKELSENKSGVLIDVLKEEIALDREIISARAKAALSSILHNYSDFAIGTIDSFVHKIVRSFAFDLNIPMDFEIEMDSEKLLTRAIDELLNKIGTDEKLTKALIDFAESKALEEKSWHIENDLQKFAYALLNEDGIVHIKKLKELEMDDFFKIRDALNKEVAAFEIIFKTPADKACQLIEKNNIPLASLALGERGIGKYFINISKGQFDKVRPNKSIEGAVSNNKWTSAKASPADISSIELVKDDLMTCFNEIQTAVENNYKDYVLFKLIRKNIYSLAVLNEIEKIIIEIKKEDNILHISEFNKIISKIVFDQPAPFIYERIGEKYQNYLVDEFQDTSVLQWQNILPLIDNSLAYNHFNMIVGDGKQAIYRWRGGEVEQFTQLPQIKNSDNNTLVKEREQTLKNHFLEKKLNRNYRSKPGIIDFNNNFFASAVAQLSDENNRIYKDFEQESGESNSAEGYVSIQFLNDSAPGDSDKSACIKALEIVTQNIKEGYSLNDITILTRNNREANVVTAYLIDNEINVVSSESLLLKNSPTVNFISSVLTYLQNNNDAIAKSAILEYLLRKGKIKEDSLDKIIGSSLGFEFSKFLLKHGIELNTFTLLKMPLYDLCEELIRVFGLNAASDPYLLFFLDEVFDYASRRNNNIADFMQRWETQREKASIVISEGANAVNVMTIHKSKGLEFPVVILPFANWAGSQNGEKIWIDLMNDKIPLLRSSLINVSAEIEETDYAGEYSKEKGKQVLDNINLLYVAMTRAVDQLHIVATEPKGNKNTSKFFIDFLKATGAWEENKFFYEYGIKSANIKKNSIKANIQPLTEVHFTNWRYKVAIKTSKSKHEDESRKDYGIIIHELFSRIKTEDDIETAIDRSFYEGSINEHDCKILAAKLRSVISNPLLKPYFVKGLNLKQEAEIILPGGESFRPDRVIIDKNKAIIIDYKTGKGSDEYKEQLNQYEVVLRDMGFLEVDKLLVYFEEEKIEKV